MLRIYTASRFNRGDMWLDIQNDPTFKHQFHARWLRHWAMGTKETPERAQIFWQENLEDIQIADYVLIFSCANDIQGGAFVEVGAALAMGKNVLVTGKNEGYRTWIYHPLVKKFDSLQLAFDFLDKIDYHG